MGRADQQFSSTNERVFETLTPKFSAGGNASSSSSSLMEAIMDDFSTSRVVRSGPEDDERTKKKELTEDDIIEILARLPAKSLLRFKCVSKHWYSLILSPTFIAIHSEHSYRKNEVSLLLYPWKNNVTGTRRPSTVERPPTTTVVSFWFGDATEKAAFCCHIEYVEIVGCFNGVVCLSLSQHPQKYALWNPATRQIREIGGAPLDMDGNRNSVWTGSGFFFDPFTDSFKVTQLKFIFTGGEKRAQVNVFSTATNSWTEKTIVVPYPLQIGCFGSNHCRATFVNGYMHWHISIIKSDTTRVEIEDMYILSYNMFDEVFHRVEMPFPDAFVYYHLAVYKESLAMFVNKRTGSDSCYNEVDVWVLNDCGGANQSWSKLLTCRPSLKVSFASTFFRKDNVDLVLLCEESSASDSLYLYNPENGETKKFWREDSRTESFLYSESLASLN